VDRRQASCVPGRVYGVSVSGFAPEAERGKRVGELSDLADDTVRRRLYDDAFKAAKETRIMVLERASRRSQAEVRRQPK